MTVPPGLERLRAFEAAAHDLRQPLQIIVMALGAVERNDGAKYAPVLERAKRAVETLDHSLGQCADALRLGSGAWQPEIKSFEARSLAKSLATEYAALAANAGLELRVVFPDSEVCSDPQMLGRLLGNLIINALAFTARGGVLVAMRRRTSGVLIQVFDTGGGHARQGLGIGFQLAERLTHALGCELAVRSVPAKGSCCAVLVPVEGGSAGI